jgi:osmotically-inducible protein OsmY
MPNQYSGKPQVVEDGRRDESLAGEVRMRLEQNEMVDESRITVQVVNADVFLSGTAENRFIRERAETLAREVEGVSDVINKVSVQPPIEEPGPILSTHEPGANNSGSTQRS